MRQLLPQVAEIYTPNSRVFKWRGNVRKYRRAKVDEEVGVALKGEYFIVPNSAPIRENDIIILVNQPGKKYRVKAINEVYNKWTLHHYEVEVEAF